MQGRQIRSIKIMDRISAAAAGNGLHVLCRGLDKPGNAGRPLLHIKPLAQFFILGGNPVRTITQVTLAKIGTT